MKLNKLQLRDKPVLGKFLRKKSRELSSFSFVNIFIWKDFFQIFWSVLEGNLCIFAKNEIGCFMYLPPIGGRITKKLINTCFEIMDKDNMDKNISRIENIEEKSASNFKKLGLKLKPKDSEYLYLNSKLKDLSGNDFKAKRANYNFFIKNYEFKYCKFSSSLKSQCLKLYKNWSENRKGKYSDLIFQSMLNDNIKVHALCFDYYKQLDLIARVVKINNEVKAYCFGYKLNKDTFCILLEICDLSFKGLAQFIFREFCRETKDYKFINAMDDSGLDNIKQAKLSYHPFKLIPSYIATR